MKYPLFIQRNIYGSSNGRFFNKKIFDYEQANIIKRVVFLKNPRMLHVILQARSYFFIIKIMTMLVISPDRKGIYKSASSQIKCFLWIGYDQGLATKLQGLNKLYVLCNSSAKKQLLWPVFCVLLANNSTIHLRLIFF